MWWESRAKLVFNGCVVTHMRNHCAGLTICHIFRVTDVLPLLGFFASVRKHTEATFAEKHPEPLLVYIPRAGSSGPDSHFVTTQVAAVAEMRRTKGTEAGKKGMEQQVSLIRKSARNPFAQQIYIGRAPNNDVVIDDPSVSKSHAFLDQEGARWRITDMGSANGTWLNGVKVGDNTPRDLIDGVKLTLGTLEMQFFTPQNFYRYVAALLQASEVTP
jgi:hypothetical protein